MHTLIDTISEEIKSAFRSCGFDDSLARATVSNRPDLCEYQCNGALGTAKKAGMKPMDVAVPVAEKLRESETFSYAEAAAPGFINMNLSPAFLSAHLGEMAQEESLGVSRAENPRKVLIDYGGANVAKPLHVGHLRSAIIGESIKRICRFMGDEAIGDVHLGDWGLQMGLIISELKSRQPDLPYFDESYTGEYPSEPPFTISELEEIYPAANARSKQDEAFREEAKNATVALQQGLPGYRALWNHILNVSIADLKKNYDRLNVHFELWKKESDVQDLIPGMIEDLKNTGLAYYSDGALVVDVKEETDKKEIPPCMILKSDGGTLYNTTDLATLVERRALYDPDRIIYVVDKRQGLYFEQVFRCARKTGIVRDGVELNFLGFGTMNGTDGKPFKTRDGGVMRLENLIAEINEAVLAKMQENRDGDLPEMERIAEIVGLSALKYGDLSNQASKDYIFDLERFASFEGNTGPYILYTMVRIASILKKSGMDVSASGIRPAESEGEKELQKELCRFPEAIAAAYAELAPHKICSYIYDLSDKFNHFYHNTRILAEEDEAKKAGWLSLLQLTHRVLSVCVDLLGFAAPEWM